MSKENSSSNDVAESEGRTTSDEFWSPREVMECSGEGSTTSKESGSSKEAVEHDSEESSTP
eukprot:CAMPEP_0168403018 /NCGR_PEP_ID=MMETSP0228-20121227/23914_1 /TAXON_ID=133427 /ORGANISM="Protoceratium reticulatum, Strain CCCM 535 (=CCMP 1889)" /LENGTH=60 /DNA_ID=CAMNT_0008416611 /DNA_START=22 /DNA_END=201 /DNA_ORIENTATION=+